jgi:hypothetical protein
VWRRHDPTVYRGPDLRIARKWIKRKVILTGERHPTVDFRGVLRGNPDLSVQVTRHTEQARDRSVRAAPKGQGIAAGKHRKSHEREVAIARIDESLAHKTTWAVFAELLW